MSGVRNLPALAAVLAFLIATPTLLNLAGVLIDDGNSFAIVAGGAFLLVGCAGVACLGRGWPRGGLLGLAGLPLALAILGAVFWTIQSTLWISGRNDVEEIAYSAVWLLAPAGLALVWRDHLDLRWLVRAMAVCGAAYVAAMTVHYLSGGGYQHSGRWHAGTSLEAIRCGRYAVVALWVMLLVLADPDPAMPRGLRLALASALPLALLILLVSNARGPWLAFVIALLVTAVPLWRLVWPQLAGNARLMALMLTAMAASAVFLIMQLSGSETRFDRLVDQTQDGGSSASRLRWITRNIRLFNQSDWNLLFGTGYRHALYYPHNIALEALVDGGLPHLVLLVANLALAPVAWLLAPARNDPTALALIGVWVISIAGAMVSGSVTSELLPWQATLLLALYHRQQTAVPALRSDPTPAHP